MQESAGRLIDLEIVSKIKSGLQHKAEGNRAFQEGRISEAIAAYHYSLLYLAGIPSGINLSSAIDSIGDVALGNVKDEKSLKAQLCIVYNNLAICMAKQGNTERALHYSEKDCTMSYTGAGCRSLALRHNPSYIKAIVRKIEALKALGQTNKAAKFIKDLLSSRDSELKKGDRSIILKMRNELNKKPSDEAKVEENLELSPENSQASPSGSPSISISSFGSSISFGSSVSLGSMTSAGSSSSSGSSGSAMSDDTVQLGTSVDRDR